MSMAWELSVDGTDALEVTIARGRENATVWIGGRRHRCDLRPVGDRVEVTIDDRTHFMWLVPDHDGAHIHAFGRSWYVEVADPSRSRSGAGSATDAAAAPMPGTVIAVEVAAGDPVAAGQVLIVIESMKMQNEIVATRDGIVEGVLVEIGETFDRGALLVALVPEAVEV